MNLVNVANWIRANWFSAHRGARKVGSHYLLFGNDGLGDPLVTAELASALRRLRARGHDVVGMAADEGFFTWVLVVRPSSPTSERRLTDLLFEAWMGERKKPKQPTDVQYVALQTAIAIETMAEKPMPQSMRGWLARAPFRKAKVRS